MMPSTTDVIDNDVKTQRLQEKITLKSSGLRRQSALSVKDSWHWLRSNLWVLPLIHTHIWLSAGQSLLQPFFPPLASTKAIPAWKYGLTFSSFKAFIAIGSLSSQSLIEWTSPKFAYLLGLTGFFLACVGFALLYWCPDAASLLGGSIAAACLGGFTEGVYIVTLYAMCTDTFLHNKGVIIATMDGMYGMGCMLGAVVGGTLIDLWAFPLPYFVCGILLMGAMPYFLVKGTAPQIQMTDASLSTKSILQLSYYRLLANPRFMINMGSVSLTFIMLGFYEPTLEPYVRQFRLTSTGVGTIFMVTYCSYFLGAITAGVSCHFREAFTEFLGVFISIISFLVVGPAPFLHLSPALWLVYLSQVCVGFSAGTLFTSCYYNAYNVALECGYPETISTSAFISSSTILFQMSGAIVTPPAAGYIVEAIGFREGTMVMFGILLLWMPFSFGLWMHAVIRLVKNTYHIS
ncbi:MFS-type transporter SLC18B1-like isoform X2 [Rhipicephalus microplus]|uniref:MFS-type transporter SLC18B1-like isoform X2 n=1 Tax=Rhipicephalus microplus TaxID=6941 RepID=UPI003F6ADBB6